MPRVLNWTANRLILVLCVLVLAVMFFSGPIADRILANAIGPEDLELPPVAYPMRQTAELNQTIGGQGGGLDCSLPPGLDFLAFPRRGGLSPISLRMRQACVFHDYCYRHGAATYNYSQADCDYMLQEQAFRLCTQININKRIADCETEARKVTLGVRLGGWGSYKRPDAAPLETGSTYFEFDPYPIRSPLYSVVRVADAPARWRDQGADAKAYYVFRIRQSGIELRIIGIRDTGTNLCAALRLPSTYDSITVAPLVVRSRADGSDWLVWWRRETLTNTEGSFAGISPGSARLADWQRVFGSVVQLDEFGCDDLPFSPEVIVNVGVGPQLARQPNSFTNFKPYYEMPLEEELGDDVPFLRFKEKDTLISEFVPLYPGGGTSRRNMPLALYGLTTHGCSAPGDNSSCLAEIEIDPASDEKHALYEPYVAYDTRCIADPDHRLYGEAKKTRGSESCDRYRNFNHAPFISTRDGTPELVWIRRGNSVGTGYETSALLRRAPRRDSTDRGELSGQRDNFDTFALDGYSEQLEPSALLGKGDEALVSVVEGGPIRGRCILLYRIEPRKIDEFRDNVAEQPSREAACIDGLDRSWLERPWQLLTDGTMLFFRTRLDHVDGAGEDEPERWDVQLEVAVVDPRSAGNPVAAILPANVVGSIKLCRRASQDLRRGDAQWVLRTGDCFEYADTELARGRDITKQIFAAARIMRSAPIVVADTNGDAVPDIGVLLPRDGRDVGHLRGRRDNEALRWVDRMQGR